MFDPQYGSPKHMNDPSAARHLLALLRNLLSAENRFPGLDDVRRVTIHGFSKGGVVLNQLLYAFQASSESR